MPDRDQSTATAEPITFGRYLSMLLEDRSKRGWKNMNAAWLSKRIGGKDPTTVRDWLRDERVPLAGSDYVELIAQALQATEQERANLQTTWNYSLEAHRLSTGT